MSDKLRKYAAENCILEIVAGSHLYGTSTPESDEDYVGVFLPPPEYVLGLQSVQEVDFSVKDKSEDGKNTADAVDRKLYEFRKFINLALQNNPNIIEILFTNEQAIKKIDPYGQRLLALRNLFPSRQCVPRFLGYAKSQKHKMIMRRDRFNELRLAHEVLSKYADKDVMAEVFTTCDVEYFPPEQANGEMLFWKKVGGTHIHVGDICFEPGVYVKKARKKLKERLDKVTNRSELILKYGYDTKFASHLIRLLYEGLMLLEYGELEFPLPMSSLILDIKNGAWEVEKVIEFSDELEKKYNTAEEKTKLPKTANFKRIEEFTINTMRNWLG
jgi:hypothetical protein